MISANNITLRLGKKALFEDVNIKFTEGNCYGMIGANGAGKSTFLKILSGQLEPTSGDIVITPGQRLSFLQQDHFKYDAYTVLDTVIMGNQRLYDTLPSRKKCSAGWKSGRRAAAISSGTPRRWGPCWRPVPARPMERGNCADRWTERWNRRWPIRSLPGLPAPGSTGLRTVRQRAPSSSGRTRRQPFDTGQGMTKMPCILQNFCYHRSNRIAGGTTCTPCFF